MCSTECFFQFIYYIFLHALSKEWFSRPYVVVFLMVNELWLGVIVCFVDIVEIVDNYCLNFIDTYTIQKYFPRPFITYM